MSPLKNKTRKKSGQTSRSLKWAAVLRTLVLSLFPYLLTAALLAGLSVGAVAYTMQSPTFNLSEVRILNIGTITQQQAFQFCELQKGENLVRLDLVNVQEVIKAKHPEFKEVYVRRVLPNRIEVFLKRRTPVAQIAFGARYVQIDKDFIVLPGSNAVPFKNLTVIEGTPLPRGGLRVGSLLKDRATEQALRLTQEIKRQQILKKHALTRVSIQDPKNITLIVEGSIEIRIGNSRFLERLKLLDQTLKTLELDPARVRYIDLRFDDVLVNEFE